MAIGKIIRERRKQLHVTQEYLAEMADIHINTLYKLENDKGNPTLEVLHKIGEVLGLELTYQVKSMEADR
ncbi:MAG: helix-turn-helix transcriptional regulator [Marinilabiliaceae bacterium]|nr:helix-turn-helix transcriptional regulator [Marinilabiliaceae bacterium]